MKADLPDDRLREAFWARATAPGEAGCPAAEGLWDAVHGQLAASELAAVVDHTAGCAACAEAWRLAVDLRRQREPAALPASAPPAWRKWASLAAAAALLVALGVVFRPAPPAPEPGYREPYAPVVRSLVPEEQRLARDRFLLRWSAGPPGARYDLLVAREDLQEVARARGLTATSFLVPPSSLAAVPAGARLLWQVEVDLADGGSRLSPTFYARLE